MAASHLQLVTFTKEGGYVSSALDSLFVCVVSRVMQEIINRFSQNSAQDYGRNRYISVVIWSTLR